MTVLDYSKKLEQLFREAYLLKKDQVIKPWEVLWTWQVRGRQGWQLLVMQNVIRDEVRKVHACFARTEWVMLLLLDSLAAKKIPNPLPSSYF